MTRIGILGGMGPRATVHFERILLDALEGTDQQLPTIITINDGSIPDRTTFLLEDGEDPVPQMQTNLALLEHANVSVVCIPCNTACTPAIFGRLKVSDSVRLLNLPGEVAKATKTMELKRVYLLATEGTATSGSFQQVCASIGAECVVPEPEVQKTVSAVIMAVKQNKMELARLYARRVKVQAARQKCDGIILGCTELPLVASDIAPPGCKVIDTLEVLARAAAYYTRKDENDNDTR